MSEKFEGLFIGGPMDGKQASSCAPTYTCPSIDFSMVSSTIVPSAAYRSFIYRYTDFRCDGDDTGFWVPENHYHHAGAYVMQTLIGAYICFAHLPKRS